MHFKLKFVQNKIKQLNKSAKTILINIIKFTFLKSGIFIM